MKKYLSISLGLFAMAIILLSAIPADAQWRSKTHDKYEAVTGVNIKIDGKLGDWAGVPVWKDIKNITGQNKPGPEKSFEEWDGGKWTGPDDQTVAFMWAWDAEALYLGISVTDDYHNAPANGWNGDAAQLALEGTGKRPKGGRANLILYNVALGKDGKLIVENQNPSGKGLGTGDVAIVRDGNKTNYEIRFSAAQHGAMVQGRSAGASICVNDGDEGDQAGQKGWGGWYPHSIVFGNQSEKTGLLVLSGGKPTSVESKGKLSTTWGDLKQ